MTMPVTANFHFDRPHAGKTLHVDLTQPLPSIFGADKVEVDANGNVLGGTTFIGKKKIKWEKQD